MRSSANPLLNCDYRDPGVLSSVVRIKNNHSKAFLRITGTISPNHGVALPFFLFSMIERFCCLFTPLDFEYELVAFLRDFQAL